MKRYMILALRVLAVAVLPTGGVEPNEAEKLFRDMEKKIRGAKAIQVVFTYQLEGKTTKGSLLLTSDNKARFQVRGPFSFRVKGDAKFEFISDGKRLITKGATLAVAANGQLVVKPGGQTETQTPKTFHAGLISTVCRVGMWAAFMGGGDSDPDNSEESRMMLSGFTAGATQKVEDRQAKVVHYRCGKGGEDDPEITVWSTPRQASPYGVSPCSTRNQKKSWSPRTTASSSSIPKLTIRLFGCRTSSETAQADPVCLSLLPGQAMC